ncbi:MAG: hypothetical protein ABI824_10245 [Acidobacteriota bacterium]
MSGVHSRVPSNKIDVDALTALKGAFTPDAGVQMEALLRRLLTTPIRDPQTLIHLHETALFLRAYPQNPAVVKLADRLLFAFGDRLRALAPLSWEDSQLLEAGEVSGIAGTGISTNFSYSFARSLASRHGKRIQIDWTSYAHPERLGPALARVAPLANEDWTVEGHVDWHQWLAAFAPRGKQLHWLLEHLDPTTYDSLEIPILWSLGDSSATRSRTRLATDKRDIFYHAGPLLKRRDVSLEAEFSKPKLKARGLKLAEAQSILDVIVDTSAVRYRELWGFLFPDIARTYQADLGRGMRMVWFGVPPSARLPLRAYHCGMFFKNGVPIGYVEVLSLFERMEVGFNLYYTFREGESAWLYAQVLKFCREQYGVTCFTIDPYQLGHENEEAVDSGAIWFYRKLGFRSTSPAITHLIEREERKLATDTEYRTSPATLRRMAAAPMLYGHTAGSSKDWDGFSLRRLLRRVAMKSAAKNTGPAWAAILAVVGDCGVSARQLSDSKNSPDEKTYLHLLQSSPKLRQRFLKLGVK